jgi:hypothetical protein
LEVNPVVGSGTSSDDIFGWRPKLGVATGKLVQKTLNQGSGIKRRSESQSERVVYGVSTSVSEEQVHLFEKRLDQKRKNFIESDIIISHAFSRIRQDRLLLFSQEISSVKSAEKGSSFAACIVFLDGKLSLLSTMPTNPATAGILYQFA